MQEELFDKPNPLPLAACLRPKNWEEFVGQKDLVGPGEILNEVRQNIRLPSFILWGPPGCGKTTLARLLAKEVCANYIELSAIHAGVGDIKKIGKNAKNYTQSEKPTLLFLDEIHRFNKAQQDSLLSLVEEGIITLIGATTENPSFSVISPLLSRLKVLVLKPLLDNDLKIILHRALSFYAKEKNLFSIDEKTENILIQSSNGDARKMLNTLEIALGLALIEKKSHLTLELLTKALQTKIIPHDRNGENHYDLISALIKSLRGSDPNAGLYYLARLLEAGEDPLFVARRLVILASEDIGNANPKALELATASLEAVNRIGMPEAAIILAHVTTYLAGCPKSNASTIAYDKAVEAVRLHGSLPVPLHLRNAPTKLMKELGYGKGYKYAHDQPYLKVSHDYLPKSIQNISFYEPKGIGYEKEMIKWFDWIKKKKE